MPLGTRAVTQPIRITRFLQISAFRRRADMKKPVIAAAVLLGCGTVLFYARCMVPSFDRALGFPLNSQVQTCALRQ